jgi:opacity protein-like surface antigen
MKTPLHRTAGTIAVMMAIALFTAPSLLAQDDPGVRFGLKLSPNLSMLRSETKEIKASGNKFGYTFGLITEFPIGNNGNYRFATGLSLLNTGGATSTEFNYFDQPGQTTPLVRELETTYKLQYIELPLTVKLMTNEIGYMRYFAQVGFSAGFNIAAKADIVQPVYFQNANTLVEKFEELENENVQDDINLFRVGLVVGAGAEYNFSGNTSLLFGIAYNNGFTNIANFEAPGGKKARLLNNYLELTVGMFF